MHRPSSPSSSSTPVVITDAPTRRISHANSGTATAVLEAPASNEIKPTDESLVASVEGRADTIPGLGALRRPDGGVAFRVWAPNAEAVSVVGTFNNWDTAAHEMTREENGTWYVEALEAKAGDEYKYRLRCGDVEFERVDPRARKVVNSAGNGIVWWVDGDDAEVVTSPTADASTAATTPVMQKFETPLHDALVIYEMHIGTFNAEKGGKPGTFDSAIAKLDYLRDLGVNCIEIMPVAEFAGDFSWGYNPAHPFAVESIYGGPEGLKRFIAAAHARGIAVVIDAVYNHFGPSDLSLWQFDGWNENGLGGIYFYNDWRAATPWGDTRPDYGRGEVRSYIRDNAMMWMEEYGADGLRWDMTVFIRTCRGNTEDPADDLKEGWGLLQWMNNEIHGKFPRAITIAEDLRDSEWLVKGTGAGGAGFNSQWDSAFVHPVRATMIAADDQQRDLDRVISALKNRYDGDAFKRVVYSESHDEVANGKARMPTEIQADAPDSLAARKRSLLAAALAFTAPGIPMIFQGQELLEDEWFRDSVPLDWTKSERFAGIHRFYRDLIALRRNLGGHTLGLMGQHIETHHVNHERRILGYQRWRDGGPGDHVVVLVNLSHQPVTDYELGVPGGGTWRVRLNSDGRAYSDDFTDHAAPDVEATAEPLDGQTHRIKTGIGAYSLVILSQDRAPAAK